jgi:two-component SAPR family response regulator
VENARLQENVVRMLEEARARGQEMRQRDQALQASLDVILGEPALPSAEAGVRPLQVCCLGPLEVYCNEELVTQWGGEKAGGRQAEGIFAFLVARRRQGVTKDEFLDLLWPELDLSSAENNLHRTLHALRRALEPDLQPRQRSSYVIYRRNRYWLNPSVPAWIDAEEFTETFARGRRLESRGNVEEALAQYRQAEALYRGEYMQDASFLVDSVHVESTREHLRETYAALVLRLGYYHEETGRPGEALTCYQRGLLQVPEHPGLLEARARVQAIGGPQADV